MKARIFVRTHDQMKQFVKQLRKSAGQIEKPDGRRASWRLAHAVPGVVEVDEPLALSEPIYIVTRDISVDGLGFMSHQKLRPGQKLLITIETDAGELEIPTVVVHATASVGMFKIGVKFDFEED